MSDRDTVARQIAARRRRAVPVVGRLDLLQDPDECFALAPIRVVSEEVTQAVAFGNPEIAPTIVVEHHPLSMRTGFLEELSDALDEYLSRVTTPRICLPHESAVKTIAVFGSRYERSKTASEKIRRLGYLCRILYDLSRSPGQQIVVVLGPTIRRHFVTGQNPKLDGHLGSLLTWLNPPQDGDVRELADRAALRPAASMLHFRADERIERLRRNLKKANGIQRPTILHEIEEIQRAAALEEWTLLSSSRNALWGAGLPAAVHQNFAMIRDENAAWFRLRLATSSPRPARRVAMARLHDRYEYYQARYDAALLEQDDLRFEQVRDSGGCFIGTIEQMTNPPKGSVFQRDLEVRIEAQHALKIRAGGTVRMLGPKAVSARVASIAPEPNGDYRAHLALTQGIRSIAVGQRGRWATGDVTDRRIVNDKAYKVVREALSS